MENEENENNAREFDWIGFGHKMLLIGLGTISGYNINHPSVPLTAIMKDVNKDSIADIITYNSQGDYVSTLIGVKDSSNTINYIEAEKLMKQKESIMNSNYSKEKSQLEKQIEQYKK